MKTATISASKVNGGIKVVIANPSPELLTVMRSNNFELETDLSNTYAKVCKNPEEMTVVQNAVRGFFGR